MYFDLGGNTGAHRTVYTAAPDTVVERLAFSQGAAAPKIYKNGTLVATGSATTRTAGVNMCMVNRFVNGQTQEINYFAILNEQMTDGDVAAWAAAANPTAYFDETPAGAPLNLLLQNRQDA